MTSTSPLSELRELLIAGDGPASTLLTSGLEVAVGDLPARVVAAMRAAELVDIKHERLVPRAAAEVWRGSVVVHDIDTPGLIERETVLGVNNTTRALAACTPRSHVRRALDLATGPGGLALLMAEHADTVIATDVSERACRLARLNADMNGVGHIDVRVGDLFEPVADEAPFDLITGNLPFVVSPDRAFTFRDGGRDRDEMSRSATIGAGDLLAPGGVAVLMVNWLVPAGTTEHAGEEPLSWMASSDLDAIVLHHSVQAPLDYAERWNRPLLANDPVVYGRTIDRWVDTFAAWDIDGIAYGTIALHRPTAPRSALRLVLPMRAVPHGDGGSQLTRIVDNGGWLADHADDDVLRTAPSLAGPHRLDQSMRYDGSWSAQSATMVLDDTVGVTGDVEPLAMHVVLRLDGESTIADIVDQVAAATGLAAADLASAAVATVRELLRTGCLSLDDG